MKYGNSSEYEQAAIELLFGGKAQRALALFDEGLRRFPDDAGLSVGRGMALNDLKRPSDAREIFTRVIEKNPNLTDALQGLAEAELALGNKTAATAAVRKACDHPGENSAEFVHGLGILLYRHGLFADAEHCYRSAVEIDRAHGLSWIGLASCLHHQGRRDEAIKLLKEAVEDRLPGLWEAYSYLGCMLCDAGRTEEAVKILGKIPIDELRDPAAVKRLRAHLDQGKNPERAQVLAVIEKRAAAALREAPPASSPTTKKKPADAAKKVARKPKPRRLSPIKESYQGTFIVGPVHGDLTGLKRILRHAKLIDGKGNWRGRNANLIVAGPILKNRKRGLHVLRYLIDIQGSVGSERGKVEIVLSRSDAAILRELGEAIPNSCRWAALAGDHLVTAGGVLPEVMSLVCKERPSNTWRGGGWWRQSVVKHLANTLREDEIGGIPDHDWKHESSDRRQIFTCDMPPGATGLEDGYFIRLNSGLKRECYYINAYGYGEKPSRIEVPPPSVSLPGSKMNGQ